MGCLDEIPATCRAKGYDYCNSAWKSQAVNASGEQRIARGEVLDAEYTILAPYLSGGVPLGDATVDRVIIKVPKTIETADGLCANWCNSGLFLGVWVGGRSGTDDEPIPWTDVISGKGLFIEPGDQKEIFVQNLRDIRVAGIGVSGIYPSISGIYGSGVYHGFPVTFVGEVIVC